MTRPGQREGQLPTASPYGDITITVKPMSKQSLETYYHLRPASDGAEVRYYGHKDDLAAAGCLPFGLGRYEHFQSDGHGGSWVLSSKAGPGKRGFIAVNYYVTSRAFAAALPGVTSVFPEAIIRMAARPHLRLVINNTRAQAATYG